MTGCNFAVAETGTFVVCTNEGNADLSANVPKLHIASIGIEKIIPRLEHLGGVHPPAVAQRIGLAGHAIHLAFPRAAGRRRNAYRAGGQWPVRAFGP